MTSLRENLEVGGIVQHGRAQASARGLPWRRAGLVSLHGVPAVVDDLDVHVWGSGLRCEGTCQHGNHCDYTGDHLRGSHRRACLSDAAETFMAWSFLFGWLILLCHHAPTDIKHGHLDVADQDAP